MTERLEFFPIEAQLEVHFYAEAVTAVRLSWGAGASADPVMAEFLLFARFTLRQYSTNRTNRYFLDQMPSASATQRRLREWYEEGRPPETRLVEYQGVPAKKRFTALARGQAAFYLTPRRLGFFSRQLGPASARSIKALLLFLASRRPGDEDYVDRLLWIVGEAAAIARDEQLDWTTEVPWALSIAKREREELADCMDSKNQPSTDEPPELAPGSDSNHAPRGGDGQQTAMARPSAGFDELLALLPPRADPRATPLTEEIERLKQTRDTFTRFLLKALVVSGAVTARHITSMLRRQHEAQVGIMDRLLRDPAVPRETLRDLAGCYFGVPTVELCGYVPQGQPLLDQSTCTKYRLLPLAVVDKRIVVATDNPANVFALDDVRHTTGHTVDAVYAHADGLTHALTLLRGESSPLAAPYRAGRTVIPSTVHAETLDDRIAEWHALRDLGLDERADDSVRCLRRDLEDQVRRDPSSISPLEHLVGLLPKAGLPFAAVPFVKILAAKRAQAGDNEGGAQLQTLARALLRRPWAAREWDRAQLTWDVSEERLSRFLVQAAFLDADGLRRCRETQSKVAFEGVMGRAIRLGLLSEGHAVPALGVATQIEVWTGSLQPLRASVASWVPAAIAHERGVLPLGIVSGRPVLAISNPFNENAVRSQTGRSLGSAPRLVLLSEVRLRAAIEELYGALPGDYEGPSGRPPAHIKLSIKNLSALLSALAQAGLDVRSEFHATRVDYSEEETFALFFDGDRVGELQATYVDNHFWAFLGIQGTTADPIAWRAVVGDTVTLTLEVDRVPFSVASAIRQYQEDPAHAFALRRALQEHGKQAKVVGLLGLDPE